MAMPTITGVALVPLTVPPTPYRLAFPGHITVTGTGFTGLTGNNFNVLYARSGSYVLDNGSHTWGGISITPDPVHPDTKVTLNVTPYSTVSTGTSPGLITSLELLIELPLGGPYTPDQIIIGITVAPSGSPLHPDAQSLPTTVTYST